MPDKDAFAERERALEEEYFRKKDKELIEKLRRRAAQDAERRQLAEATGVSDNDILQELQDRGFTADTVKLLPLVPLLQVAWSDGAASAAERDLILQTARTHGIEEGSAAHRQLSDWLARKPSEPMFESALRVIHAMFEAMPADRRAESRRDLVSYCLSIASASGGWVGLGRRVSPEEHKVLERISAALEQVHGPAVARVLDKVRGE